MRPMETHYFTGSSYVCGTRYYFVHNYLYLLLGFVLFVFTPVARSRELSDFYFNYCCYYIEANKMITTTTTTKINNDDERPNIERFLFQ